MRGVLTPWCRSHKQPIIAHGRHTYKIQRRDHWTRYLRIYFYFGYLRINIGRQIYHVCCWYRCSWYRWCTLTCEFLKNIEMTLMLFSVTLGKMIHEKNLKQKNSWHCSFKDSRQLHTSTVRSLFETPHCTSHGLNKHFHVTSSTLTTSLPLLYKHTHGLKKQSHDLYKNLMHSLYYQLFDFCKN